MIWIILLNFDINKNLEILNIQNNVLINSELEELHICNKVRKNKFINIINAQKDI